ncbi:MAG: methionine--tRNA ligase subunit beta [Candidatus Diapherotrites archaeon]
MLSFADFAKMELKVATIESAEDVPGKDKLYKLSISLGEEKRILVAGIKQQYSKEALVGRQIIIVANLEPRKLAGIESQGMLLAADIDGKPVLLKPDVEVPDGSVVR